LFLSSVAGLTAAVGSSFSFFENNVWNNEGFEVVPLLEGGDEEAGGSPDEDAVEGPLVEFNQEC